MKLSKKLGIILASLAFALVFVVFLGTSVSYKLQADTSNKIVYVSSDETSVTDLEGHTVYVPTSSYVYFYINFEGRFSSSSTVAIVKYRTVDYTANSKMGDYVPIDGQTTLSNSLNRVMVKIEVKSTQFVVNNNYNTFKLEIYSVEASDGSTINIDNSRNGLYGACKCSKKYNASNGTHINQYQEPSWIEFEEYNRSDDSKWYVYEFWHYDNSHTNDYYQKSRDFVATGLANMYLGGYYYVDSSHTLDWSDDVFRMRISTYDKNVETEYFYSQYIDDIKFDYDSFTIGSSGDQSYRNYPDNYSGYERSIFTSGKTSSKYVLIPFYGNINGGLSAEFYGDDICKAHVYNININATLIDTQSPNVVNWAVTPTSISKDDYIYVTARFNEPIRANSDTALFCSLDAMGQVKREFSYVGGSGTNTLVFRALGSSLMGDDTKRIVCSKITPFALGKKGNSNARPSIYDYGSNASSANNQVLDYTQDLSLKTSRFKDYGDDPDSLKCPLNVNIDLRKPSIEKTSNNNDIIAQSHKITFRVEEAAEDSIIYYTWSNSKDKIVCDVNDVPSRYEYNEPNTGSTTYLANSKTIMGSNMDGEYYLHVRIVSKFGNSSDDIVITTTGDKPFRFDNTSPSIQDRVLPPDKNNYLDKEIQLSLTDGTNSYNSGIFNIYILVTNNSHAVYELSNTNEITEDIKKTLVYSSEADANKMTYDEGLKKYIIKLNALDNFIGLTQGQFGRYYIGFQLVDNAGNEIELKDVKFETYDFDTRDLFDTHFENTGGDLEYANNDERTYGIDLTKNITLTVYKDEASVGALGIDSVKYNGEDFEIEDFVTNIKSTDEKYSFIPNSSLKPGCYQVTYGYDKNVEGQYQKVSKLYSYYLSSTLNDNTYNKEYLDNHGVLINTVYQINNQYYYYKNADEQVIQSLYGNVAAKQTFSSKSAATNYIRYMELQDLNLYHIDTQSDADLLYGGLQAERKLAYNEFHVPQIGDYYIRYKRYDWIVGDMTSSNWVYYYYSSSMNEISPEAFSENLNNALDTIINAIVNDGGASFLSDDQLDKYGSPFLREGQYHYEEADVKNTLSGSKYKNGLAYDGDKNIISSEVEYSGIKYRLLSNYEFTFNQYSKIFYKIKSNTEGSFTELTEYTKHLAGAVNKALDKEQEAGASGIYSIIEMDENGIHEFEVYIDCTSPVIKVSAINKTDSEETIPQEISRYNANGKTFNARQFDIIDIEDIDHFGYIGLYKVDAVSVSLQKVLSYSDIKNLLGSITNGNYLVKVYDRSGNNYSFNLRVNDTDLSVEIVENPNVNFKVVCNRLEEDIQAYQIRFNGELVDDQKYAPTRTFTENGLYDIYVTDWYGGVYNQSFEFKRILPDVSWRYENGSVVYQFDETADQEGMYMRKNLESEDQIDIYTNGILGFTYPTGTDYSYEFIGNTPKSNQSYTGDGRVLVRINSQENYTVKIYYTNYPNVYSIYNIYIDNRIPTINASIQEREYLQNEIEELSSYMNSVSKGEITPNPENNGKVFIPENGIGYTMSTGDFITYYFGNNSLISSKSININVTDDSLVKKCEVFLNETLINTYEDSNGVSDFILSREGEYKIIAYDALGNFATFEFTNSILEQCKAYVDGVEASNEKVNYCSESFELETKTDGTIILYAESRELNNKSEVLSSQEVIYSFYIEDGVVKQISYVYDDTELTGINVDNDIVVYEPGKPTSFQFGLEGGISFNFEYIDGFYKFKLLPEYMHEYSLFAKFYTTKFAPVLYEVEISSAQNQVHIISNDVVYDIESSKVYYLHDSFTILEPYENEKIFGIWVYDIEDNVYFAYDLRLEEPYVENEFSINGSYMIEVQTLYGVLYYSLIYINDSLSVNKEVTVKDLPLGEDNYSKFYYSGEYDKDIYSNDSVRIISHSKLSTVIINNRKVAENGEILIKDNTFSIEINESSNSVSFVLSYPNKYEISITDEYKNVEEFNVFIRDELFSFPKSILYGFNDNAMSSKDAYYTKNKISIDVDKLEMNDISYIKIQKGDSEGEVVYDVFSENKIQPTKESLEEVVGKDGSGEYIVIVRDTYGNMASTKIKYSDQSSLILTRTIRSNGNYEDYDINQALTDGFYSNNTLRFESNSPYYEFKVNGKTEELKYTLAFKQGEENVSYEYNIYYKDEYGYEYNFIACLARVDVNIEATKPEDFVECDTVLTTKHSFAVTFKEGAVCTYTLNGQEYPYTSGEIIKDDGVYRFQAVDFAGNLASITYKKDSVCEYSIVDTNADKHLLCGDVANNQSVAFSSLNGDDAYIHQAFLDGIKIKNVEDNKFNETGHYELLIKDKIGNTSYFDFYVVSHPIKGFTYETPSTYHIESINYTTPYDGIVSVLSYVEEGTYTSKFSFGSVGDRITNDEDGYYEVKMYSPIYGTRTSFYFTIDNVAPTVSLVGCNENEETLEDITLTGCSVDDTIRIYKDGKLTKTIKYKSSADLPVISDGGEYVIEITNLAGLKQELKFKRRHVSNGAGSALIFVGAFAFIIVLFIGLIYRTKSKADK